MTTQPVLVLLTEPNGARAILDTAAAAARALAGSPIDVVLVRADPAGSILPNEAVLTSEWLRAAEGAAAARGATVYAEFEAWREAGHAGQWDEVVGVPAEEVRRRGHDTALLVMALPPPHAAAADRAALEAALFDTGRPVLAVPVGWRGGFGRHLAVGWRSAPATRRSLTALRPWLDAAETITVLTVTDAPPPPPDGPLAELPGRVTHRTLTHVGAHAGGSDGAALLASALAAGADGLAMGAYRSGRMLEWMLGGVTEHVLQHATLPLLLMH